jgi:hypothetical protein
MMYRIKAVAGYNSGLGVGFPGNLEAVPVIESSDMAKKALLRTDEAAYLAKSPRCEACEHLEALHTALVAEYCKIPGCKCRWHEIHDD